MLNIEKLTNQLRAKGFDKDIEEIEITKNACKCKGIRIVGSGNMIASPVIYYSQEESVEAIAEKIIGAAGIAAPDFDLEQLRSREFVASRLYLAVTRRDGEGPKVIRRSYLNLDLIMKVMITVDEENGEQGSIKATKDLLDLCGMSETEAFDHAYRNSASTAAIVSLTELMGLPEEFGEDCPLYVGTCNNGTDGASIIAFTEPFRKFCEEHDLESLLLLPSSTQEIIINTATDMCSTDDLLAMVNTVNLEEVSELIQLAPAVYRYDRDSDSVSIIATMQEEKDNG